MAALLPIVCALGILFIAGSDGIHSSFEVGLSVSIVVAVAAGVAAQLATQRRLRARRVRAQLEAQARYRTLVEQLPLITYIDSPHSIHETADFVSPQIERILGYSPAEWSAHDTFYDDCLHPDDRERVTTLQKNARETGEPLELEYRIRAKDGTYVWLADSHTIVLDDDGLPWYSQGFALDVTARKQAEADREVLLAQSQVQNAHLEAHQRDRSRLLARTVEVAEHERMQLAAELHDGPIQKLTVVAFNLDRLARRIARNEEGVGELVGTIRDDLQAEMHALRGLMTELRPPILDERNLAAALNDCAEHIFAGASIQCHTSCEIGGEPPAHEVETVVYRVVREALINVRRHSGATRVDVSIQRSGDSLRLLVADNGKGFEHDSPDADRVGVLGMQERIGSVGGQLEVVSTAGAGTRIEATLPWKPRAAGVAA